MKILLSYYYFRTTDLDQVLSTFQEKPQVFADSGAYSAMTRGETIDVKDFANWLKKWKHHFTVYSNLDKIGSAEGTRDNQKYLEDAGLNPLPVFHTGEAWSDLEYYVEKYPYIALGGMVPYQKEAKKKLMPWLVQCFKIAGDRSVFHGFGCTSWEVLKSFKWYSVDSSSWGQGFRFGKVPLFDPARGTFQDIWLGDRLMASKYAKDFRALGFDPLDFADRTRNSREKICAISGMSFIRSEGWLHKRHGLIRVPGSDDAGLHLYLVDTRNTLTDLTSIDRHMQRMKHENSDWNY